jgi:hypothetical protein
VNLRVLVESDLADTLEGDWGLPVILIDPNGNEHGPYQGQVLYDTTAVDPETGMEIIVHKPVVTLRRSSLSVVPQANEKWIVQIPTVPDPAAVKETFFLERPSEDGGSIGFIRLYLMEAQQATP